jgi:hypothetical protein
MSIGQELLNVPMGDMIRQMAFAIAEGQMKLDATSIEIAEMMGGLRVLRDDDGNVTFDDSRVFFGAEWMTVREAQAFIAADKALSGGNTNALNDLLELNGIEEPDASATAEEKKEYLETRIRVPMRLSMLELGFSPTFYQFVDTIIEVKIAIKISREQGFSRTSRNANRTNQNQSSGGGFFVAIFGGDKSSNETVTTSQVDASYSSKYSYSAEGASLLRTKLVPIPPPAVLEERVRRQMDEDTERRRRQIEAELNKP